MVVEIYDCLAGIESKKETGLRIRESSKKKNRRLTETDKLLNNLGLWMLESLTFLL